MSSEMGEYVAALRDREHRFHGMGGHYVAEVIRGELEAILARTEAGADGAVSMNPIGYVDLASWQADWNAGESFFTDYQDEDTQPIYTQAQMERAIEMAKATRHQDASGDAEDAAMFRWLSDNARPWESDYEEPHALIRICRGEFQGGIGWFNIIGRESRVGIITLRDAVRAAMQAKEAK